MQVYFSSKNFNPSVDFETTYNVLLTKLRKKVAVFEEELPLVIFVIEYNQKTKTFIGRISLSLGKNTLYKMAHGTLDQEVLCEIFNELFDEFDVYRRNRTNRHMTKKKIVGGEAYEMPYL